MIIPYNKNPLNGNARKLHNKQANPNRCEQCVSSQILHASGESVENSCIYRPLSFYV